jgi:hypothetical protein
MKKNEIYALIKEHLLYSVISLIFLVVSGICMEAYFRFYSEMVVNEDVQYFKDMRAFSEALQEFNDLFEEELKKRDSKINDITENFGIKDEKIAETNESISPNKEESNKKD